MSVNTCIHLSVVIYLSIYLSSYLAIYLSFILSFSSCMHNVTYRRIKWNWTPDFKS